ncbi:MAG TPA: ImuA protein [Xanthobacteraceae bacterium]|jgi:protein ImuA
MSSSPIPVQGRNRAAIVAELRRLLPRLESVGATRALPFGLTGLDAHLPQGGLTVGALHEVAPQQHGDTPAAFGFLAALLAQFMARFTPSTRPVLLIAAAHVFAEHGRPHGHGLHHLGLDPARLILVETRNEKQALWAMEEALRSGVPAAVGSVAARLDLKASQRLQLTAGETGLPLLLLRPVAAHVPAKACPGLDPGWAPVRRQGHAPISEDASAAATRWRIGAAEAARDRFGLVTHTRWNVRLERCRNGRPGDWLVEFDHAAYRFSLAAALADPALPRGAESSSKLLQRAG